MGRPKNILEEIVESTPKVEEEKLDTIPVLQPTWRDKAKAKLDRLISEESKTVKGRFRNHESPGGSIKLQMRKYPGIPDFDKLLTDGEMYEVPLYIARHLNGVDISAEGCNAKIYTCQWPTNSFIWKDGADAPRSSTDGQGIPTPLIGVGKWNKRYSFDSLEFDVAM
jgi:hypothetical protein